MAIIRFRRVFGARFAIPSRKKGLGARALILEILFFLACPARTARLGSPFWQAALDKQRKAASTRGVVSAKLLLSRSPLRSSNATAMAANKTHIRNMYFRGRRAGVGVFP